MEFKVNDRPIARLGIHRVEGDTDPNSVNTYSWEYTEVDNDRITRGDTRHRYGDGAPVLVGEVCGQLSRAYSSAALLTQISLPRI
ncbi:hypothetical protein Saroj_43 [Mycobacterium phage Saroj]|nr:hypothetical protein Saroj_43 [Mycobacterium phage Saroj]